MTAGYNHVAFTVPPGGHIYILMEAGFLEWDPRIYPPQLGKTMTQELKEIR